MKTISSAIFYMSEWQAIFQCEEYSFCEARPYQDKQKNMIGLSTFGIITKATSLSDTV